MRYSAGMHVHLQGGMGAGRGALLRGEKVMRDADLAELYGVETGALNRAVKRNSSVSRPTSCFSLRTTN